MFTFNGCQRGGDFSSWLGRSSAGGLVRKWDSSTKAAQTQANRRTWQRQRKGAVETDRILVLITRRSGWSCLSFVLFMGPLLPTRFSIRPSSSLGSGLACFAAGHTGPGGRVVGVACVLRVFPILCAMFFIIIVALGIVDFRPWGEGCQATGGARDGVGSVATHAKEVGIGWVEEVAEVNLPGRRLSRNSVARCYTCCGLFVTVPVRHRPKLAGDSIGEGPMGELVGGGGGDVYVCEMMGGKSGD